MIYKWNSTSFYVLSQEEFVWLVILSISGTTTFVYPFYTSVLNKLMENGYVAFHSSIFKHAN